MQGNSYVLLEEGAGQVLSGRSDNSRANPAEVCARDGAHIRVDDPLRVHVGGRAYNTVRYGSLGGGRPPAPGEYTVVLVERGSPDYPSNIRLEPAPTNPVRRRALTVGDIGDGCTIPAVVIGTIEWSTTYTQFMVAIPGRMDAVLIGDEAAAWAAVHAADGDDRAPGIYRQDGVSS